MVTNILHCKREVYQRYEKGLRDIPISYAIILSKYYDVGGKRYFDFYDTTDYYAN